MANLFFLVSIERKNLNKKKAKKVFAFKNKRTKRQKPTSDIRTKKDFFKSTLCFAFWKLVPLKLVMETIRLAEFVHFFYTQRNSTQPPTFSHVREKFCGFTSSKFYFESEKIL